MEYSSNPEVVLSGLAGIPKEGVPEIKVRLNRSTRKTFLGRITDSNDVADFVRSTYKRGELELQEQIVVLYLNNSNQILGYYRHSVGGINSTIADVRLILGTALKTGSIAMVLAHNHPSGNKKPSAADKALTEKLRQSASSMDITLLDHLIITKQDYFSFADNGLMGLNGISIAEHSSFRQRVESALRNKEKHTKTSIEKLAGSFGITDRTLIKELTESVIVSVAREIAHEDIPLKDRFEKIVDLYNHQVNLSHRTSQSILLQQYSTPAPIAFLAGTYCEVSRPGLYFEPSAGNGLLTIAGDPKHFIVNEVDEVRRSTLETDGFKQVTSQDATQRFHKYYCAFDAVLTNPPFGRLDQEVKYGTYPIRTLDHLMALRALDTVKHDGKAAVIIGGHTKWDDKGRIQAGKNRIFFNYLYAHYNVADVINIDGHALYARQGTAFDVRLILIDGRKSQPTGAAPLKDPDHDKVVDTFEELYWRVNHAMHLTFNASPMNLRAKALKLKLSLLRTNGLEGPYNPASEGCVVLNTQVPDSMDYETHEAIDNIRIAVGGSLDEFVKHRLGYNNREELCRSLSAEQIDAVAIAIYNIEARGQGMVIGDQTGIGKGRIAASMIRYAHHQGHKPIFLTEKANLFSDIYRDLNAIGSAHLSPLIINSRDSKSNIKDESGNIVYQAPHLSEQHAIFEEGRIPANYDYVVATYSQFNSPQRKPAKPNYLGSISKGNIMILDESHNASGSSNTGEFLQNIVAQSKGVTFLSATFAKRPDNLPIYAMKTAISEANMTKDELVNAIEKGGVAMQEIIASQLVKGGQMLRRERSFEGVEVNYMVMDSLSQEHRAIADNITSVLRDIIAFQLKGVNQKVQELDDIAKAEGEEIRARGGTERMGVDNQPFFSKVFNVINQMLFSLKADAVAERALKRLQEGKKPVIAFASTMGSFIEQMENERGLPVGDGDVINADFAEVLRRGLEGVLRYTVTNPDGSKDFKSFEISDLEPESQAEFYRIEEKIDSISTGITISPIDIIVQKLEAAGYNVAEVTGRKYAVQLNTNTGMGMVKTRKKVNTNDAFREFNNNQVDVLLINQSGSTGASAHAIVTEQVSEPEVKQRVMIVLQAELDINTEVQKRGRINRTGQILKPIYDYLISSIPAEQRLMMMLQQKLKSLDANTSSNQKQSTKILDVPDFLNKYGDQVVTEYLKENPEINDQLDDPLGFGDAKSDAVIVDAAHKVSGRVAVLSTKQQELFYSEITTRYLEFVEYLKQVDEYDLEVEALNLETKTSSKKTVIVGKDGQSSFSEDSILETVEANVLRKPFKRNELQNLIQEALDGRSPFEIRDETASKFEAHITDKYEKQVTDEMQRYDGLIAGIPNEPKAQKILAKEGVDAFDQFLIEREKQLNEARLKSLQHLKLKHNNIKTYLSGLFKFFYVGKLLKYPVFSFDAGEAQIPAVFLGFIVDERKSNPYAPSAVKLRIAVAGSLKYMALPASYHKEVNALKGASALMGDYSLEQVLDKWEDSIKETVTDRQTRYILTGNLLQGYAKFQGKLVSYTTKSGEVNKGILMPEYWIPKEDVSTRVTVPIVKAIKLVKSLANGAAIYASNNIAIFRQGDNFRIIVPASRKQGGDIYLNDSVLPLVIGNNFEKTSDKMVAFVAPDNIERFVMVLQEKFNASVTVTSFQYESIQDDSTVKKKSWPKILFTPVPDKPSANNHLRLKAKALKLKLRLLAA